MKKLPKNEILWVTNNTPSGVYYVTSDKIRTKYNLWRQDENEVVKVKSAATPDKFNDYLQSCWDIEDDSRPKKKGRTKN